MQGISVTPSVADETDTADFGISPTTSLPTDKPYRPILVNIANDEDDRPSWGLAEADTVYDAVYWGKFFTSYLALHNDAYPEIVGPVRRTNI